MQCKHIKVDTNFGQRKMSLERAQMLKLSFYVLIVYIEC